MNHKILNKLENMIHVSPQLLRNPIRMKQAIQGDAERDKETEQRLNNLLRRVPDDPAFLLKRKMQLEAQKRQYRRPPSSDRSDW